MDLAVSESTRVKTFWMWDLALSLRSASVEHGDFVSGGIWFEDCSCGMEVYSDMTSLLFFFLDSLSDSDSMSDWPSGSTLMDSISCYSILSLTFSRILSIFECIFFFCFCDTECFIFWGTGSGRFLFATDWCNICSDSGSHSILMPAVS